MKLKTILKKHAGRSGGKVTSRHDGGRSKRFLRTIDFKRNLKEIWAKVESVEYDPNRNARIAKLLYENGVRSYIIAPDKLKEGMKVISSSSAPLEVGNFLPLSKIPVGFEVSNIEIKPGFGGQIARGAGIVAFVFGKDETHVLIKMPSGEIRKFDPNAWAMIGQIGNVEDKNKKRTKAGASRWRGIRPHVRGVAMHPNAHPHGGGEGRSRVGLKYPKTPWGKKAVGKTRFKRKYSNSVIVESRQRRKK
ncbi:50S ribosomal protein L2 [Candidatus Woesebacteria bacterium GWC2_33_12]|uniref:Large ribosomal subunit protein uL2 n=1 Tax=Candidatus Woesebacteria bacterium GW2011_GWB1_33_22 TaxID=1618566 RepID=A0A0G0C135_9BACT|nr:MAG: 50S ribosomal protein L2 [Candidatus Woesebacteria bacterium GW2011_GWC2_33_12]KKP42186.1 MAG: 50S ribosomal protein L2 [Candidatus Woesebacteria bacterium GW2011_GWA2_33_20]KKP44920.1 MAG: 50S ribosomal protein L2 [Candidatus Woesebacteria bacterium GW2011_GWB1_33_22]KKP46734.1 MAG: 50S ribosomal protein L2 [Microgenomates group bacterium GW2011_GWC1_33_28]KKP50634.1 MAG: 50S ribosomal protein L2 [Candidatus Woesebacteria bacterium GW2011_GWA1_33_33]OGM07778.1 MAG: 50S ribosomal prote